MNKTGKRVFQGIVFILIIIGFIYVGTKDFSNNTKIDNEKFDQDYSYVDSDNVFKYINASDVYSILRNKDGIIFMGYPSNKWSGYYASMLNDVAKELGIKEILYYNFYEDRDMKNATYQSIVLKLSSYLPVLDNGNQDIYAPTLILIKKGKVVGYDNETAINKGNITPDDYWNDLNIGLKKNNLKLMLNDYLNS